jgi:uncharacterized membrane protein YidH (DUF202 family)
MSDTGFMLAVLGCLIGAVLLACGYWVWLDAKEAALQRKHDAEMADAAVRVVRAHKHDDRHTHEQIGRPE